MKNNIIVYSQPGCPQCKMVKMMLEKNHINFEENQDIKQIQALGFNHTPVVVDDGKAYVGKDIFD